MKPIKLQFSGLNSYRTRQEIDFEALGADGLFGIFGPTGSGKSSILDAITLALYGEVDRAFKNRGIIHQLEKTLEVSFQFELGKDCYLVERRYGRNINDPDSANAKQARLRCLNSGNEEVLASKPQEVTDKIEGILGINSKEFSRAVVLPQGKFDKFLTMTGADRAAMLEHLFNLEQYGEVLVAKVKNEAANCIKQLERIEGEEQGLGDCSKEAINQALLDLKTKNDAYTGVRNNYEIVDKSYQQAEAVRDLFLKRKNALEKLNQLVQDHEIMAEKQSRLNAAERAEPLRELITRQKDLTEKINKERIDYQSKQKSHSDAVTKYEETNKELQIAEQEYNEQLPFLHERKVKYQAAQDKQEKVKDIKQDIDAKKKELEVIEGRIGNTDQEMINCRSLFDKTRRDLEALQQERSKLIVNPDEKEAIEEALTILVRLEESEKRYRESKANYTNWKSQNDSRWTGIIDKVHEMLPEQSLSVGDNIEYFSKSLLNKVENDLSEARKAQQKALIANSAVELVKELHEGEPCPVCGSREHPLPVKITDALEKVESAVNAAENKLKEVRNWEGELLKLWHNWSTNESLVNDARELTEKYEKELQVVLAEFEKGRGVFERDQLRSRKQELTEFERRLHSIDQKREEFRKGQEDLTERLQKLNDSLQNDKIKKASAQEALKSSQLQLTIMTEELNEITDGKDLADLIREMKLTYDNLKAAVDHTKRKEGETRAVMEKIAREISALEATQKANRNDLVNVEQRLTQELTEAGFTEVSHGQAALLSSVDRQAIRKELEEYRNSLAIVRDQLDKLDREIDGRKFDEAGFEQLTKERQELSDTVNRFKDEVTLGKNKLAELREKQGRWNELQKQKSVAEQGKSLAEGLGSLLRGRKFVSFLAQEHLRDMTLEASYQLGRLTGQRYALELAKEKDCEFVIRDDYNGGQRRMINSLSGGEVFMTSLALALALSSKIQLRGKYPLGFFFLDEGFGSLDEEKLDKVMSALEKLHDKHRMVGVISHVREMKERLPRYLEVVAAGEDGSGSRIKID